MANSTETVGKLFDYAIELERAIETLYRRIGNMFTHHQDIAQFWKRYADDERGHASYLERVKEALDIRRLSEPAYGGMIHDVQKCLGAASQRRLDNIQNLEDAYQLASELENSETNAIFEFMIMNFSTDELAISHKFLRAQLNSHLARLQTGLPSQYGNSVARRNLSVLRYC